MNLKKAMQMKEAKKPIIRKERHQIQLEKFCLRKFSVSASPRTPQFIPHTVYECKAKENKRQKQLKKYQ